MKRRLMIVMLSCMVVISPAMSVHAMDNAQITTQQVSDGGSVARADVIVTKYREYKGVLQYRRWNQTQGVWVDPYWITMT